MVDAKNDLVYMKPEAEAHLTVRGTEDYRGRKCYELLQGLLSPCRICLMREKGLHTEGKLIIGGLTNDWDVIL